MIFRAHAILVAAWLTHVTSVHAQRADQFVVTRDQEYSSGDTLKTDIYMPSNSARKKVPTLIFFGGDDYRKIQHYTDWAKFSASNGFAAVVYTGKRDESRENFDELLRYLLKNAARFNIDEQQIAIYAGSGTALEGLPAANENKKIKAALIFYGTAIIKTFRTDLPVLLVRAGQDNINLNKSLDTLMFRAMQANAPYTVVNYNTMAHAFENIEEPESRMIMKDALDFLTSNMQPAVQAKLTLNKEKIEAMRALYGGNWREAIEALNRALLKEPQDSEIERYIANAYIEIGSYDKAIEYLNSSLSHGNWRKGEIGRQKCLAFARQGKNEAAVSELPFLKKIGWFDQSEFESDPDFRAVVLSEAYRKFIATQ